MKKICITGGQGFIGSYLCQEFLDKGYEVHSVDNFSKYGWLSRPHDKSENFYLHEIDLTSNTIPDIDFNFIIAGASVIGGIRLFHDKAFDIIDQNERILSNTFRPAIEMFSRGTLERIVPISSSMVFECSDIFPTPEDYIHKCTMPQSSYGRQKLMVEWWADAAFKQYKLPYTIIRPYNAIGLGEEDYMTGYSHVVPDLIWKVMGGAEPLEIMGGNQVRCFTNGKDIARGIRMAIESPVALNKAYNISTSTPTKILDLAKLIWKELNGDKFFRYRELKTLPFDVQYRYPDVELAKKDFGFEAEISLEESVREVVGHMRAQHD